MLTHVVRERFSYEPDARLRAMALFDSEVRPIMIAGSDTMPRVEYVVCGLAFDQLAGRAAGAAAQHASA